MSIFSLIKRAPKITSAIFIMIATAVILPLALNAWGPGRDLYTVEKPAKKVTFNSITNNPVAGDERNFVVVKDAANTADGGWQDNITVQPGKEYLVRVYVHNNAASNLNLTAKNTRVSASVPTTTGKNVSISGFVTADNSDPLKVWDDISFSSDKTFNLAYVAGSAEIWNNGYAKTGKSLPDSIVTSTGALIGYNGPDGKVPGCFQYANYVYFKVKPQFAPTDKFETTKQVRKAGTTTWASTINANPGDNLEYLITYKNVGEVNEYDVVIKDTIPAGITYVNGSSVLTNNNFPNGKVVSDNVVASSGINIGSYKPGSSAKLQFSAKVASADKLVCGVNQIVNKERTIANGGYIESTATTIVTRVCDTDITVCELSTQSIITIKNSQFDTKKHSKDLSKCDKPNKLTVCELSTKKIISIDENKFDSSKYSKDLTKCSTTPTELPQTGPVENIVAFLGLGALIASVIYYVNSRRIQA